MRSSKALLLAALSAAALVGAVGVAAAKGQNVHTMTIAIPDGGVAEIRYTGDRPPQVTVSRDPVVAQAWAPIAYDAWGPSIADLDRIAAQMDRRAAVLLEQVGETQAGALAGSRPLIPFGSPGGVGYSFASAAEGARVCGRSVEITSTGPGQAPRVQTRTWGDCGSGPGSAAAGGSKRSSGAADHGFIQTRADAPAHVATANAPI